MIVEHPVERFFTMLAEFGSYPAGVGPIPARIPGIAFFPQMRCMGPTPGHPGDAVALPGASMIQ